MFGYTKFKMEKYFQIMDLIKNNPDNCIYAFACSDNGSFGGWLITKVLGSEYSHAGIFDPSCPSSIIHMKGKGFLIWHVLNLLKEVDVFAVAKYELDPKDYETAILRIDNWVKNPPVYDFQQEVESDNKIYCSELVYKVLKDLAYVGPDGEMTTLKTQKRFDRQVFEPDDVVKCATKVWRFG